jgi:hypothetical protein
VEDIGASLVEQINLMPGPTLGGHPDSHPLERTIAHESILARWENHPGRLAENRERLLA